MLESQYVKNVHIEIGAIDVAIMMVGAITDAPNVMQSAIMSADAI